MKVKGRILDRGREKRGRGRTNRGLREWMEEKEKKGKGK